MKTLSQCEINAVSGGIMITNANSIDRIAIPTGIVSGMGIGAAIGALLGGPVGALWGGNIGSVFGASIGATVHPVVDLINKE